MKIINVAGARPNFMKVAPIMEQMREISEIEPVLVHTGQHYDKNMSELFFRDLCLPEPDIYLGVGSGSHASQTAKIMVEFEKVLIKEKPDLVLVVGDVNSTLAAALTAVKLHISVAHVEAGLRSFDRNMPEEINRVLTDAVSDYLFITEKSAEENLIAEGRPKESIFFVGNVMIDSLLKSRKKSGQSGILSELELTEKKYALCTLHRPENVDNHGKFSSILEAVEKISRHIKVIFPLHPRTQKSLESLQIHTSHARRRRVRLWRKPRPPEAGPPLAETTPAGGGSAFGGNHEIRNPQSGNIVFINPLGYFDFLKLMSQAKFILTDSGGIQEETTFLGVPCLTLRDNTERPVTVSVGTNSIVGTSREKITGAAFRLIEGNNFRSSVPELWDGEAARRIVGIIQNRRHEVSAVNTG